MSTREFNRKYGLNINANSNDLFKRVSNSGNNFVNVAGKPKKILIEILKRFFTNWAAVACTIIFIIILILSIVSTLSSAHDSTKSISDTMFFNVPEWDSSANSLKVDENGNLSFITMKGSPYVKYLPPSYNHWTSKTLFISDEDYSKYINAFKKDYFGVLYNDYIKSAKDPGSAIRIITKTMIQANGQAVDSKEVQLNTYQFYRAMNLYIFLGSIFKGVDLNAAGVSENQIREIIAQIEKLNPSNPNLYPNSILGTNELGIDIWTSSWVGTWNAIKLALIIATIQTIIGVAVGCYLGFHVGSWIDTIIMRLIEIFVAPPALIWLLLFASTFGTSDWTLIFALVFTGWTGAVGGTRLFIITVKDSEFITASKSVGASKARLIYKHALPAIIGKIANSYVSRIPGIIMSISSLAFLGFFKGDNTNLGALLVSAASQAGTNFWILLLPSVILLSISVSLHFMAIGLHDALDPRVIKVK